MKFDYDIYKKLVEKDRLLTKEMVANGEIDEDEAYFRDWMREDEILDMFE